MHGTDLTLHHATHHHRGYPLDKLVERFTVSKLQSKGKRLRIDPPLPCSVWHTAHGRSFTKDFVAITHDPRAQPLWDESSGRHSDTVKGARLALCRSLANDLVNRHTPIIDPTFTYEDYEHVPDNTRRLTAAAIKLATHIYWWESNEWGLHFEEVNFIDIMVSRGSQLIMGFEVKSCRADFTADKKWQGYLPYCHRFSFVTVKGAIRPDELPDGIGLYYLNPDYIPFASGQRRHTSKLALLKVKEARNRPTETRHIIASLDSMLLKAGPVRLGKLAELGKELRAKLAEMG